jgi:hypothetical protein
MSELSGRAATGREDEAAEQPVRVFVDADGVRWSVKETPFSEYDRRRGVSLIFWSEGAVRRVRDYPADWQLLPDEDLALLSWKV